MKTIHDTPGYRLDSRTTDHPITGRTVELFASYPQAQHPRYQRIACLTLPLLARIKLAAALLGEEP